MPLPRLLSRHAPPLSEDAHGQESQNGDARAGDGGGLIAATLPTTEAKGNIVWKAPAQPGSYEVALIVSDGVIRAMQTVSLEVRTPGANP